MKEESDIPLLKSYNKDTTVIETDPFMEKEIDELIRAYAQPQEIVRRLRDVGYSEEEVRQSYKFQFYCEILKQIQKDKEEEKAELRLSIPFIVSLVVFSLFSLAATIGIFFSVYFIFLALYYHMGNTFIDIIYPWMYCFILWFREGLRCFCSSGDCFVKLFG